MALPTPRIRGLALREHLRGWVHEREPPRRSGAGRANLVDVVDRPQQLQVHSYQSHGRLVDPRGFLWARGQVLSRRRGGGGGGACRCVSGRSFPLANWEGGWWRMVDVVAEEGAGVGVEGDETVLL